MVNNTTKLYNFASVYINILNMEYRLEYIDGIKFEHPKILYKYRDWNNVFHKKILTENRVYFSSPSKFEDQYDCHLTEIFPQKCELYDCFLEIANSNYPNILITPIYQDGKKENSQDIGANILL